MKNLVLISLLWLIFSCQYATSDTTDQLPLPSVSSARIDSFFVRSTAMQKELPTTIILPAAYYQDTARHFPVVYLLHGYSGRHSSWAERVPNIGKWADLFELLIVLPEGDFNSWYIDSPIQTDRQYATYTGLELPAYIDQNYRTIPQKEARAISGLSMGGHGAMYLACQYPQQFGAVGSMSGGLDLRPFPNNWDLAEILGTANNDAENWAQYSVINQLEKLKNQNIPIYIDCGKDDFFFATNVEAHQRLDELEIPHEFIIRPGAHTWEYWNKVLPHHLLFFHEFFTQ